ncbi:hypothetical protein B0O80DRAFT_493716 [Mortierella sp. GBAus27b]|nr:hypothetical protein B0O80DRAFT_493716 [Mortierella sp. GBAus27b]
MSLFKSNKNKSASAASTPAQTPRSSMQATRPKATTMTPEEALQMVMDNHHLLSSSDAVKYPQMTPPKISSAIKGARKYSEGSCLVIGKAVVLYYAAV